MKRFLKVGEASSKIVHRVDVVGAFRWANAAAAIASAKGPAKVPLRPWGRRGKFDACSDLF
jgi:hypothetical protein